ncbi:MAG: 16S rRNA methyltransferase [Treponema sp.]|jgi:16S rRNA (cytosine1407-C5)-methyltransferase|nr:16S rRNA methyltransferase [Treponema sp.]
MNAAFESYYAALYGNRWEGLRKSLLADRPACAFSEGLCRPYFLDYASVLAARCLRLSAPDGQAFTVLDACAAPGGKSLVIAPALPAEARLLANEFSADRRRRLSEVLDKHLPPEKRERVRVSGFDAAAQGSRKSEHGRFAAILLDAPCSGEAHVLKDEHALSAWTAARPRFLARRQWALLSSAFLLLKAGGSLVYATCALSTEENDGVVRRLFEKYGDLVVLDAPEFSEGEKTLFGRIILPDNSGGIGPMYVARFRKAPENQQFVALRAL